MSVRNEPTGDVPVRDEKALAEFAAGQHGAFTRRDALRFGLTERMIGHRVRSGRWDQHAVSVFSLAGSPDTWHRRVLVDCLRSGGYASHQTSARLHGFPRVPRSPTVVSVPPTNETRLEGVIVHQSNALGPHWFTTVRGVPTLVPARTMIDLAGVLRSERLEVVLDEALGAGVVDIDDVVDAFNSLAGRGRRGIATIRPMLAERGDGHVDTTILERLFTAFVHEHGYPDPRRQVRLGDSELIGIVDFVFPEHHVIVEVDGRRGHLQRLDFERDRLRDQRALMQGYRIVRITYRQLTTRPWQIVELLDALLGVPIPPAA